jgi:hypothetical protein
VVRVVVVLVLERAFVVGGEVVAATTRVLFWLFVCPPEGDACSSWIKHGFSYFKSASGAK